MPAWRHSGQDLLCVADYQLCSVASPGGKIQQRALASSSKSANSWQHHLMILSSPNGPHLQMPSSSGLGFQHVNLGWGTQTFSLSHPSCNLLPRATFWKQPYFQGARSQDSNVKQTTRPSRSPSYPFPRSPFSKCRHNHSWCQQQSYLCFKIEEYGELPLLRNLRSKAWSLVFLRDWICQMHVCWCLTMNLSNHHRLLTQMRFLGFQ